MIERFRQQRMRSHNRRPTRVVRMHWLGILLGIERLLSLYRPPQVLIRLSHRYGSNPGHVEILLVQGSQGFASEAYTSAELHQTARPYYRLTVFYGLNRPFSTRRT